MNHEDCKHFDGMFLVDTMGTCSIHGLIKINSMGRCVDFEKKYDSKCWGL